MLELLLAAVVTCLGSLALGQGVLAICGARQWSWLAAPIGLAALILLAVPAIHVPGRAATVAAVTAVLIVAGLVLWIRSSAQRPPLADLLAGLPVALLVFVPFAASGRVGTLGMSFDNDMGEHLLLAEAYRSSAVAAVSPLLPSYPLGPHALAGALSEGLDIRIDLVFAGISAATPVLLAWTALTCTAGVRWLGRVLVSTLVGIPFLVAAYYGEGAFKEPMEALFVLATALMLAGRQPQQLRWRRWVPLAVVMAGAVSVYSVQGLAWPAVFVGVWLVARALGAAWRAGAGIAWRELGTEFVPGALALGVMVVLLVPQIPRIHKFVAQGASDAIATTNLGNLVGPLPVWEAFGVWNNPDFRLPASPAFTAGMWTAFVLALVIVGGLVLMRSGRWMLVMAAGASIAVWAYAAHTQSPYVAAKALVVLSPLLMLLAALGLVDRSLLRSSWWRLLAPVLALALVARVVDSSWEALRYSKVAPTQHLLELRSLRPLLGVEPTLYMGDDDFIPWELAGAKVTAAYYAGTPQVPLRPQKAFVYGEPLDFDSVTAATLNEFRWVITTRDAAGSQPPAQMRLVRSTPSYELWRRIAEIPEREILNEGPNPAAVLDCGGAEGRAILRRGGVAAVRSPLREIAVPLLPAGASAIVNLPLTPGTWDLETPYTSPLPIEVSAPGLHATLPGNLERPGPRWPIGQIAVSHSGSVAVRFQVVKYWLTPTSDVASLGSLIATQVGTERVVPIHAACGRLVDWYRSA
jgi:hypothetical protein